MQEKIKHLLKCLSGYLELAKLLQKPENKILSNDLHKTNENAISSLPGLDIYDKIKIRPDMHTHNNMERFARRKCADVE